MPEIKQDFIDLIKKRSNENSKAIKALSDLNLTGICISILRQELDSFIRVMYLGRISDFNERERLMAQTLKGERWKVLTANNKWRPVTDRDMVEKSTEIKGYIQYVYKFGCAFIHLSDYHNYNDEDPFEKLDYTEEFDIKLYLNQYHGFPRETELTVNAIEEYIPKVFEKISTNITCYYGSILHDGMIEM
ncbi:MAG: hypothetical protein QNK23_11710 [Crocinitomicaceae bacterium]|nr:hypothetical protein [Crocinitomicaceae bacterium]